MNIHLFKYEIISKTTPIFSDDSNVIELNGEKMMFADLLYKYILFNFSYFNYLPIYLIWFDINICLFINVGVCINGTLHIGTLVKITNNQQELDWYILQ